MAAMWSPCCATGAIEHAAWTKGGRHLQPWRHDLSWFQMMSVDVILTAFAILSMVAILLLAVMFFVGRKVFQIVRRRWLGHAKTA